MLASDGPWDTRLPVDNIGESKSVIFRARGPGVPTLPVLG